MSFYISSSAPFPFAVKGVDGFVKTRVRCTSACLRVGAARCLLLTADASTNDRSVGSLSLLRGLPDASAWPSTIAADSQTRYVWHSRFVVCRNLPPLPRPMLHQLSLSFRTRCGPFPVAAFRSRSAEGVVLRFRRHNSETMMPCTSSPAFSGFQCGYEGTARF